MSAISILNTQHCLNTEGYKCILYIKIDQMKDYELF